MPGRTGTLRGPGRYPPGHALARSERNRKTMGHRRHARLEGRAQRLDNAMLRGTAVLRLAGIARLQNARARTAVQIPQLHALPRLRRPPAHARRPAIAPGPRPGTAA